MYYGCRKGIKKFDLIKVDGANEEVIISNITETAARKLATTLNTELSKADKYARETLLRIITMQINRL